jgi:hypothetical protein
MDGAPSLATGGAGRGAGRTLVTETERLAELVAPLLSVTVRRTTYDIPSEKVWVTVSPDPVVPFPKSQAKETIVPSLSRDPLASNVTAWPTVGLAGEKTNEAVGGWFGASRVSRTLTSVVCPATAVAWRVAVW